MYQIQKNQTPASNRRYDGDSISGDYILLSMESCPKRLHSAQVLVHCGWLCPSVCPAVRRGQRPCPEVENATFLAQSHGPRHVFSSNSNDHSTIFLELEARACASVREQHEAAVKCTITILVRMCKARTDALYSAMSYWLRRGCAIV